MRYAIYFEQDAPAGTDAIIFLEDGGIVTVHSNGEHLISTKYQNRIEKFDGDEMWEVLGEGKSYTTTWHDKNHVDQEIINNALDWLYPFRISNLEEVEFYNLVSEFNHNKTK